MNEETIWIMANDAPRRFEALYQWGLDLIRNIQKIKNPALTAIMEIITALGGVYFYLPLLFIIFWCVNEKKGFRLGLVLLVSVWINLFFKDLLKQPRPFNLDPSLGLAFEPSHGIPSGHAQMSLVFWVFMALWVREKPFGKKFKPLVAAGATFIILLIAFTRLYLGVHFPTDILAGWVLGGIILGVYFLTEKKLSAFFAVAGKRPGNLCLAAAAFLMILLYTGERRLPAIFLGFGLGVCCTSCVKPKKIADQAIFYPANSESSPDNRDFLRHQAQKIHKRNRLLGYSVMRLSFPFEAGGMGRANIPRPLLLALRCILGFAGTAAVYLGLRLALPGEDSLFAALPQWGNDSPYYELGSFIRSGLLGLWISAGAPWVFLKLGLAGGPEAEA